MSIILSLILFLIILYYLKKAINNIIYYFVNYNKDIKDTPEGNLNYLFYNENNPDSISFKLKNIQQEIENSKAIKKIIKEELNI